MNLPVSPIEPSSIALTGIELGSFIYGKKGAGLIGTPFFLTSKWTWGPVDKPVLPE